MFTYQLVVLSWSWATHVCIVNAQSKVQAVMLNIKSCRGISANKLFSCPRFYHIIKKFYQTVIKISKNSHTFTIEITLPERRSIYTVAFQENSGWQVSFLSCRSATFILFMKFKTGLNYSIYWNINWII